MSSNFRLSAMLKAHVADTWKKVPSTERYEAEELSQKHGHPFGNYTRIPATALRDLTAGTASAGGYLAGTHVLGYVDSLVPASVVLTLGANVENVGPGGAVVPRGTTAVTTGWLANESAQIGESQPVFGQVAASPKILGAFTEISRQLLLQSNAEEIVRRELRNAAGAALDAAVLGGSGASGQPLGIATTVGVGAFTGASLTYAQSLDAQADVAAYTVNRDALGWATTPTVAVVMAQRVKLASTWSPLWEGSVPAGTVIGARAFSTTNCPTGTLIFGDWSAVTIAQWAGGLQIQIDPFTKFAQGIVGVRLLLPVDVIVTRPAAFSVATSVT